MIITWEDALAAAEAEGRAIGLVKGARRSILRVLKVRFESVSESVRQKLEAVQSLERLHEILDQAIDVSSVDDLVLEP